jgi:hypothetical protein
MNVRRLEMYGMFGSFAVARLSPKTTAPVGHFHQTFPALLPVFRSFWRVNPVEATRLRNRTLDVLLTWFEHLPGYVGS